MTPEEIKAKASDKLKEKKDIVQAYKRLFSGKDAQIVLEDMRKRFFVNWPTRALPTQPEYYVHQNEGLRMAWIHIHNRINQDESKLTIGPED